MTRRAVRRPAPVIRFCPGIFRTSHEIDLNRPANLSLAGHPAIVGHPARRCRFLHPGYSEI
jgi:hypothetical protein